MKAANEIITLIMRVAMLLVKIMYSRKFSQRAKFYVDTLGAENIKLIRTAKYY